MAIHLSDNNIKEFPDLVQEIFDLFGVIEDKEDYIVQKRINLPVTNNEALQNIFKKHTIDHKTLN